MVVASLLNSLQVAQHVLEMFRRALFRVQGVTKFAMNNEVSTANSTAWEKSIRARVLLVRRYSPGDGAGRIKLPVPHVTRVGKAKIRRGLGTIVVGGSTSDRARRNHPRSAARPR